MALVHMLICVVLLHAVVFNEAADNVVLYSSVIDDGRQFACPKELVTFTCQVNEGFLLQWNSPLITPIIFGTNDTVPTFTSRPPFLANLISRIGTGPANFTSTLKVTASRSLSTNVVCMNQALDSEQLNFLIPERPDVPQNFTVDDVKRSSGGGWVTIKLSWIQPQNFDQFDIDHYDYSGTSTSGGQFKVTSPVTSTSGVRFNGTSPVHRAQITWSENPYNVPLITNFNIYITATSKCRETSPRYYASYSLELTQCNLGGGRYTACANGTCVPHCDGNDDCGDNSDEMDCMISAVTQEHLPLLAIVLAAVGVLVLMQEDF